jgi:predicted nuclease of predicted toxin-antitoxin system
MVRLYFDVHIPRSVAEQLTKRGIDILTAQADHSATLPDHELLVRASNMGRTIVTSDIRFRALAETWQKNR